jgi:hypothetical protein
MTFAKGASLDDPSGLFNSSLEGNTRRAIDLHEGDKIDEKALKASGRLMRILGSVVAPAATLVAVRDPEITDCSSISSQVIRDQLVWDKAILR